MNPRPWIIVLGAAFLFAQGASAHTYVFTTTMSGAQENPANDSFGTGFSSVTIDTDLFTMDIHAEFSNLTGSATAAHIHCCQIPPTNAIVATVTPSFTNFPVGNGVMAGTYDFTYDMSLPSSYNAAFITAQGGTVSSAFQAFLNSMLDQNAGARAYLNIHSTYRSGGEIRGFYSVVPEPVAGVLALFGVGVLALRRFARVN